MSLKIIYALCCEIILESCNLYNPKTNKFFFFAACQFLVKFAPKVETALQIGLRLLFAEVDGCYCALSDDSHVNIINQQVNELPPTVEAYKPLRLVKSALLKTLKLLRFLLY